MKHVFKVITVFMCLQVRAQMTTLYDKGLGTGDSIMHSYVYFASEVNLNSLTFCAANQNEALYTKASTTLPAVLKSSIVERIPDMENYTELELLAAGYSNHPEDTLTFYTSVDSINWIPFDDFTEGSPVTFYNNFGHKYVMFEFTHHTDGTDTMHCTFNQLRVRANENSAILGLETNENNVQIGIFATDEVLINPEYSTEMHITISSLQGKTIYSGTHTGNTHIPLNPTAGIYLVNVWQGNSFYSRRVYLSGN